MKLAPFCKYRFVRTLVQGTDCVIHNEVGIFIFVDDTLVDGV